MDPINYNVAVANPLANALQGYQQGMGISQAQQAQAAQQRQAAAQEQQSQVINGLMNNPNASAEDYAKAQVLVPQLSEQLGKAWSTKNTAQQQAQISDLSQWSAAIQNGQPQIAIDAMKARADAMENTNNGPTPDSKALRSQADAIAAHPEFGNFMIKSLLAAHPDGKKVIDNIVAQSKVAREEALAPAELRTANAKAGESEAEAAQKSLGVVGSTLGALQGKNAKPEQVTTALKSLAAKGLIAKDELSGYIAAIPSDAKQRDEWLGALQMAGMKPEDQLKFTTPDANSKLSSDTQLRTTSMNNATQIKTTSMNNAVQRESQAAITARAADKGNTEATLDEETLKSMAEQYVVGGDKTVLQNLGRGAQGSANLVALRGAITKKAKEEGMSGSQIAAKLADYSGLTAGIRTSAQISARVENAISEAKELAPLAIAASKEVTRSGLLPFGKVGIMFDTQTNDPALKKFVTANNGLVTAYGGAMARGQKPTVSDYQHAREILSTAQSQAAYEATVNQMYAEMAAASRAPQNVREHLRGEISGDNKRHAAPAAAPALPAGWSVKER